MASGVIKNISIPITDFPVLNNDSTYIIRYRVISPDGGQISSWSTKYKITLNTSISTGTYTILSPDGKGLSINWQTPSNKNTFGYDIFVAWSTSSAFNSALPYVYQNTVQSNSAYIATPINSGTTLYPYAQVIVQLASFNKTISTANQIFSSPSISTAQATVPTSATGFDGGALV